MKTLLTILTIIFSIILAKGQGNGLYQFRSESGKYGFIDRTGKIKIEPIYFIVHDFHEGLAFASKKVSKKGYEWFCIDTLGNEVFDIADNFPETNFSEGYARISSLTDHWFINTKGENEFGKTWKNGYKEFKDGVAYVGDEEYSLASLYPINKEGNRISKHTSSFIEIHEKRKNQQQNENKAEKRIIPFQLDSLWGFKDLNDSILIEAKYHMVGEFEKGICPVRTIFIPIEFQGGFYNALIDSTGQIITETEMYCYMGFKGDLIEYYKGPHFSGGPHYIDINGHIIQPKK